MTAFSRQFLCFGLLWGIFSTPLYAQAPAVPTAADQLPPAPQIKSPVDQFRQLLALAPAERGSHLTNRPPEIRKRILAKLLEYDAMQPTDRELLLRNTQLQWYLLSFMQSPVAERPTQLAMVPEIDRPAIKKHLEDWDRLSAAEQQEVLKYEKVLETLLANGITNVTVPPPPTSPNPETLKSLNAFLTLPQERREQMYAGFQKFFSLSEEEKDATMNALPANERMQMTVALKIFDQLPKPQRERCMRSFAEFSNLSDAERQEFLKNAGHWRELSPAARKAWRDLVNQTPPVPPLPMSVVMPPPIPRMPLVQSTHNVPGSQP